MTPTLCAKVAFVFGLVVFYVGSERKDGFVTFIGAQSLLFGCAGLLFVGF